MAQREWLEKDYYRDLGISSTATQEEIKKAYRKIAREDHPDKKPGDAAAEDRFKKAGEAYSVVGDKDKRAEYDELKAMLASGGVSAGYGTGGYGGGFGGASSFGSGFGSSGFGGSSFDSGFSNGAGSGPSGGFSDIFSNFFDSEASAGGRRRANDGRGANVETEITLDFREATKGVTMPIRLTKPEPCGTCHGSGAKPGTSPKTCGTCHGSGLTSENRGAFGFSRPCQDCDETGSIVEEKCSDCHGSGRVKKSKTIHVRVPAGVVDGQKVRLAGQGSAGERGKPAGDLFVTVHVKKDKVFSRDGDDLLISVPVSYNELVLGGTVAVPTLGNKVRVRIPQGTEDGTTLRVRGHGVQRRNGKNGDLMVTVKVAVPKNLDEGAKSALRKYAEEEKRSGFDPREGWEGN